MTPIAELAASGLLRPTAVGRAQRAAGRPIPSARAILIGDIAISFASLAAVLVAINSQRMPDGINSFLALRVTVKNVFLLAAMLLAMPPIFRAIGLYDELRLTTWMKEAARVASACSVVSCLVLVFPLTSETGMFRPLDVGRFWLVAMAALLAFRGARRLVLRCRVIHPRRVMIVGAGPRGRRICDEISRDQHAAYEVVGFVDTTDDSVPFGTCIGTLADIESILMRQAIDEVFITLPVGSRYRDIQGTISACERAGVVVKYRADIFDSRIAWPEYGGPVVAMQVAPNDARWAVKRAVDLAGAVAALVIAAPLMAVIAAAIKLTSPGPVFFVQERYGLNKRTFRMYKFRTMVADAATLQNTLETCNEMDGPVFKIAKDPRITPLGRLLRKTSLDELPQLFHVVTGKMSLVGPRPLPLRDVARFTRASDMRRFSVRPGLTCLWQISGRSNVGFTEWMRLDLAYIDAWSLLLDFYILAWTIPAVLRGDGAR